MIEFEENRNFSTEQAVFAETRSFIELLEHKWPLSLDTYQRGFVWSDEKVEQLLEDLCLYQKEAKQTLPYYMGTLLLHEDEKGAQRFIIDGQQRMTALCLLYYRLKKDLPDGQDLRYSGESSRRIAAVLQNLEASEQLPNTSIFDSLSFTVITVKDADMAFTFFDTQNNRGVRLQATDLLKAYHLRSIDQNSPENNHLGQTLQKDSAARWEYIQRQESVMTSGSDFAPNLFARFLWRARRWRGQHASYAGHDDLLEEFQANSWRDTESNVDTVPVYACRGNQLARSMQLQDGTLLLHGQTLSLSDSPANLPTALRQPIHEGLGFFLYAEKYAALLTDLRRENHPNSQVREFQLIDRHLINNNQAYLKEVFWLAALMYVDQFGYQKLGAFALYLEFILGGIRLRQSQVRLETAANFFRKGKLNLLDVIAQSYHPKQVLDYLQKRHPAYEHFYRENDIDIGKGVQGRYKAAVINFFHPDCPQTIDTLAGKSAWIQQRIQGGK